MRAIEIDPVARTISEINLIQNPNKTLAELYQRIGCERIEIVYIDKEMVLICDEEGRLKGFKGAFTFIGSGLVIAGKAVVLGAKNEDLRTLKEHIRSFETLTEWLSPEEVPPPRHRIFAL